MVSNSEIYIKTRKLYLTLKLLIKCKTQLGSNAKVNIRRQYDVSLILPLVRNRNNFQRLV